MILKYNCIKLCLNDLKIRQKRQSLKKVKKVCLDDDNNLQYDYYYLICVCMVLTSLIMINTYF